MSVLTLFVLIEFLSCYVDSWASCSMCGKTCGCLRMHVHQMSLGIVALTTWVFVLEYTKRVVCASWLSMHLVGE